MRARRAYRIGLVATAVVAAAAGLILYAVDGLERAELSSADERFALRGDREAPDDLVFVEIDDTTFNRLREQFPLPRIHHADAIRSIADDGAKAIGYDVQFTEPGPDPQQDNALILSTRDAGNVVLATSEVSRNGKTRIFGGDAGLGFSRGAPSYSDFPNDPGGVIRRMEFEVSGLEAFGIATAELAEGGEIELPDGNEAWIDYTGPPGTIESIPFWRAARGQFAPGTFTDKIVVVGASASSLQDLHITSTTDDELMPGGEIQANAIQTALDGFPLEEAPGWVNVAFILLFALLAPLLALRMSGLRADLISLGAVLLFAVLAQLLFNGGTIVAVIYPALSALIAMAGALILQGLLSAFERERARDAFGRFVPESVVGEVLDQADGVRLGGVSAEGTVMFSDLRGFTAFAEARPPDEVIEVLNRYLTAMSDAILDNGGTLVAYMGDGIMAVFGAPIEQEDHADRALEAAREMFEKLGEFNDWLSGRYDEKPFEMGLGLNTGRVMSGNVGSERRLEYTAIGDTTNTAARLEEMTKDVPEQLYIADATRAALTREPKEALEEVGQLAVRGRRRKVRLWTIPGTRRVKARRKAKAGAKAKAKPKPKAKARAKK